MDGYGISPSCWINNTIITDNKTEKQHLVISIADKHLRDEWCTCGSHFLGPKIFSDDSSREHLIREK